VEGGSNGNGSSLDIDLLFEIRRIQRTESGRWICPECGDYLRFDKLREGRFRLLRYCPSCDFEIVVSSGYNHKELLPPWYEIRQAALARLHRREGGG